MSFLSNEIVQLRDFGVLGEEEGVVGCDRWVVTLKRSVTASEEVVSASVVSIVIVVADPPRM